MTYQAFKKSSAGLFGVAWFIGTYVIWIPLSLITNRISYIFYFLPTVPVFCLGLGMGIDHLLRFWQTGRFKPVGPPNAALQSPPPVLIADILLRGITPTAVPAPSEAAISAQTSTEAVQPTKPENEILLLPAGAPILQIPAPPARRFSKTKLQWVAISFIGLFFLAHLATFIILCPTLNNWHIERWFT
jgi:hypothetical protein